jgi:hypothetical protein
LSIYKGELRRRYPKRAKEEGEYNKNENFNKGSSKNEGKSEREGNNKEEQEEDCFINDVFYVSDEACSRAAKDGVFV